MKKALILLAVLHAAVLSQTPFTDPRDNKTYKTTKIGSQVWMAENLNYNASGSKCYDNKESNCQKYGRLYNWETANVACPNGWHTPSNADWNVLMKYINPDCEDNSWCAGVGVKLKAASGWGNDKNGTDDYGFSALPGGLSNTGSSFSRIGDVGGWWSSSEENDNIAYSRGMFLVSGEGVSYIKVDKKVFYSVRCVQNPPANQLPENTRSKIDIMTVVNQNANELKTIYKNYLKNKSGFAGKVILKFTITPSGDVTTINIISSTTNYPEFDNAIKDQVSKWKWQPITDGGNTTPTIPFNFEE